MRQGLLIKVKRGPGRCPACGGDLEQPPATPPAAGEAAAGAAEPTPPAAAAPPVGEAAEPVSEAAEPVSEAAEPVSEAAEPGAAPAGPSEPPAEPAPAVLPAAPAEAAPSAEEELAVACAVCGAEHHVACLRVQGRCGACGAEAHEGEPTTGIGPGGETPAEVDMAEGAPAGPSSGRFHGHRLPAGEEPRWLDRPENVAKLILGVIVAAVLLFLLDLLALTGVGYHPHGHFPFEEWPGFYPLYGFASYALVVLLSILLRKGVMRAETYYEGDDDGATTSGAAPTPGPAREEGPHA